MILTEEEKPENLEKNTPSRGDDQQTTLLTYDTEHGRTWGRVAGGARRTRALLIIRNGTGMYSSIFKGVQYLFGRISCQAYNFCLLAYSTVYAHSFHNLEKENNYVQLLRVSRSDWSTTGALREHKHARNATFGCVFPVQRITL